MPFPTKIEAAAVSKTLKNYSHGIKAIHALNAALKGKAIKCEVAKDILEEENLKKKPNFLRFVERLAKSTAKDLQEFNSKLMLATVVLGDKTVYTVNIEKLKDGRFKLSFEEQISQKKTDGPIKAHKVEMPEFIFDERTEQMEVRVYSESGAHKGEAVAAFNKNSPLPYILQSDVLMAFADAIESGKPASCAILGTGTGKSFVNAAIAHALPGQTVIIVPDKSLAMETDREALKVLHGRSVKVVHAAECQSTEDFEKALKDKSAIVIMQADDPRFSEKCEMLQGKVLCIDESHQHTFSSEKTENLKRIKAKNFMLAVTGTATTTLTEEVFGGEVLMEKNLKWAVENGAVRKIYPKTTTNIKVENLASQAVLDYFGADRYIEGSGTGLLDAEERGQAIQEAVRKLTGAGDTQGLRDLYRKEADALVRNNLVRGSQEKHFLFTGDKSVSNQVQTLLMSIRSGAAVDPQLIEAIEHTRKEAERIVRVEYYQKLGLKRKKAEAYAGADLESYPEVTVDSLKREAFQAQQAHIAQSINAHALSIFFGSAMKGGKVKDFEQYLNCGELEDTLEHTLKDAPFDFVKIAQNAMLAKMLSKIDECEDSQGKVNQEALDKLLKNMGIKQRVTAKGKDAEAVKALLQKAFDAKAKSFSYNDLLNERLNEVAPDLPKNMRDYFLKKVELTVNKLNSAYGSKKEKLPQVGSCLVEPGSIAINEMGAQYVVDSNDNRLYSDAEQLDMLRTGCVMHLASTQKYTTGISIPSVLGVTQIVASQDDAIANPVDTMQMHGRNIRKEYRGAFNNQVVSNKVKVFFGFDKMLGASQAKALKAYLKDLLSLKKSQPKVSGKSIFGEAERKRDAEARVAASIDISGDKEEVSDVDMTEWYHKNVRHYQ